MELQRFRTRVDLDDCHPSAGLVEVDAVGQRSSLVGLDERDQLAEPRLELLEFAVTNFRAVDDKDPPRQG
jgi:hypothetical protein